MKKITLSDTSNLNQAVSDFQKAKKVVALTGAGISVESGIDDFRSLGGLWSHFPPEEYGTIEVFRKNPKKAWELFRALGKGLIGKQHNDGHRVLAELELSGHLAGVITQNIDNLHHQAGSRLVLEIHGDHQHLQCISCGYLCNVDAAVIDDPALPLCADCGMVLKPNVVLFGESVRSMDEINLLLHKCDLLVVVGTSAQVFPAAGLPHQVKMQGGKIFEFNKMVTALTRGESGGGLASDYLFQGSAAKMLRLFMQQLVN